MNSLVNLKVVAGAIYTGHQSMHFDRHLYSVYKQHTDEETKHRNTSYNGEFHTRTFCEIPDGREMFSSKFFFKFGARLGRGGYSTPRPGRFTSQERLGTHL